MVKFHFIALITLVLSQTVKAQNTFDSHVRGSSTKNEFFQWAQRPADLRSGVYQQATDHMGHLPGATFGQRYWISSQFATKGPQSPVIFHICGEGDVDQAYFLNDNALAWAEQLGAHVVFLEHRYYGRSLPFQDLSTEHLRYLTLDNVLEDLASFQRWMVSQGLQGPWISIGGSYSGTLSALYRQKHPELVVGALASSAPMISGLGQFDDATSDLESLSSLDPSSDTGDRQWVYQACTTFGFWEADGPSANANLEIPSPGLCRKLFGSIGMVNSASYNQKYNAPFLSASDLAPSNIFFTYGSDDVWTQLGLVRESIQNSRIAVEVIAGAGHHFDLNAPDANDSEAVLQARLDFVSLAQKWMISALRF